jgi:RNA polymerase sigma factor (sigma-70 family)
MTADSANALRGHLRRAAGLPEPDPPADGELLARFLAHRDETAFAELVRRHGPMVFAVCRRVAGNPHDADDAFQATFIVLARKARALTGEPALGAWLHGVAHRAALKARAVAAKRRTKEAAAARPEGVVAMDEPTDVLAVIEQELGRLPEKYRKPLVLCGLCGQSRKEVAAQLGVPEGTLASRLAKAREMLTERLRRRGLVLPAAAVATACDGGVAPGSVPTDLLEAATKAATGTVPAAAGRLASEVTRAMVLNKLRNGVMILTAVGLASAAGLATLARGAANPPGPAPVHPLVSPIRAADKPGAGIKVKDLTDKAQAAKKDLQGTWELQKQIIDDKELEFQFEYNRHTFAEHTVRIEYKVKNGLRPDGDEIKFDGELNYTVNPTTTPPEMTIYGKNMLLMGIYDLNGDALKFAHHGISELERPRGFAAADKRVADMPLIVWEFKRKKPEKETPVRADMPAWEKEFNKAYGLKDGEVLKRVAPPYPETRTTFLTQGNRFTPELTAEMFVAFRWENGKVRHGRISSPSRPDRGARLITLLGLLDIPRQDVEGDEHLLAAEVTGDFVLRVGAEPAKVVARLDEILRTEFKAGLKLTVRDVEREVFVASGRYKAAPLPDRAENEIEVYGVDSSKESYAGGGSGSLPELFKAVGNFTGKRVVAGEIEQLPTKPLRWHYHRNPDKFKQSPEDTDPEAVLKNLSTQTGLKFEVAKKKVPVVFVEKAEK